ncbi:Armadillo/beta-catenin family repeat-containing protein [Acanthamoeba castellanii str. Neff]|uniref:Vacuolar protein 8 n=1 Tax=Acanthamoeba castellanii (strain ATCC 30010 / Neff) TaxID=1257118 RepID=L8HCC9_ACACF|nr:Armadillo/beta-catenin family repeat-containing protein [Acanthamoeba castellanii str. Neff]ELR22850.1 Armadillo/beta-catenin family repeat-containing protein [Acanthamoeba castellanii str. Neff]
MRQLGLLQAMLAMLKPVTAGASSSSGAGSSSGGGGGVGSSKHPLTDYESVMVELTKVVANLAANNGNRQVMGESGAIRDILRLLQDLPNEEIRENLLRTIMNLSIAAENEDRIREEGGLTLLLEFLQADDTSPALLLQTVRVLVNLSCNATKTSGQKEKGGVPNTAQLSRRPPKNENLSTVARGRVRANEASTSAA